MRREDLPKLTERLGQLAEAFDRKPPTPGAMLVWLDVLSEFPIHEVESMLVDMPKRLTKFPAPADVWKACNERRSDRLETEGKALAREAVIRITQRPANTPFASQQIERIKAISSQVRPSKRAWIDVIFKRNKDGDTTLCGYALNLANQAKASVARRA